MWFLRAKTKSKTKNEAKKKKNSAARTIYLGTLRRACHLCSLADLLLLVAVFVNSSATQHTYSLFFLAVFFFLLLVVFLFFLHLLLQPTMRIRVVFTDLDGTLFRKDRTLSTFTRGVLHRLRAERPAVKCMVATG
jgi:hypothetical protein